MPLVQLAWAGEDGAGPFRAGRTLAGSPSVEKLRLVRETKEIVSGGIKHAILLEEPGGAEVTQHLLFPHGGSHVEAWTEVRNVSGKPRILDMVSSFCLSGITPFAADDAPCRLTLHRFRSRWCGEGRRDSRLLEELGLERSWAGFDAPTLRYGQAGTLPVREFFPFAAIEDHVAGITWAASLAWGGSWQIEITRQGDGISMSGGLADALAGEWRKQLEDGETFTSPRAHLTAVEGDLTDACHALMDAYRPGLEALPKSEQDGAIVFNEWCQSWGDPDPDRIVRTLARLENSPVRHFVIDAGWFVEKGEPLGGAHGDWKPSESRFPDGMAAIASRIREAGMTPGLWFEIETCGARSRLYHREELLLRRGSRPLTVSGRRFLDMSLKAARDYALNHLRQAVGEWGFGYLKIDYNESTCGGADGMESPGEKLRAHIEGAYRLFDDLIRLSPGTLLENCASGGHRLEFGFIDRFHVSSITDAHESPSIPLIAANLQMLVPPAKSQIWAVLHTDDSKRRIIHSLAATFLGRMCLSGPIDTLPEAKWGWVVEAMNFYQKCWPVIRDGRSRIFGRAGKSWNHPTGWQAVRRVSLDGSHSLFVIHTFELDSEDDPARITIPLPSNAQWSEVGSFGGDGPCHHIDRRNLALSMKPFSAAVILLRQKRR